jgi:hypothetical protein
LAPSKAFAAQANRKATRWMNEEDGLFCFNLFLLIWIVFYLITRLDLFFVCLDLLFV